MEIREAELKRARMGKREGEKTFSGGKGREGG